MVKKPPAIAGGTADPGSVPGSARSPGEGSGSPLQYSCLKNPMDKRKLEDHSPWGHKEWNTTEHIHIHK